MKGIIFDLDGVIVDTAKYHFLAWKRLAAELGIELTEQVNEKLKGVSRMESLEIILRQKDLKLSHEEKERLATKKNDWFGEFIGSMKPDEIFPGVKELINQIRNNGSRIGLASSSKNARRVLERLRIEGEFEVVVDGNMITHTKPDPEIFFRASNDLKLSPAECIVIEDAEAGIEAAVRAGMKCVGIGSPRELGKANLVVPKIGDLKYKQLKHL